MKPDTSTSHKVLTGAGIVLITQLAGQLLMVVFNRLVLSTLTIEENGIFFFVQKVGSFVLLLLVEAGMYQIALRRVVQEPESAELIIGSLFKLRLLLWMGATLLMMAGIYAYEESYTMPLLLWSVSFLIGGKGMVLRPLLEMRDRATGRLTFISVLSIVDILLLVALVAIDLDNLTVMRLIVWYIVSSIPAFLVLFVKERGFSMLRQPFSIPYVKEIAIATIPFFTSGILLQVHDNADAFFLELYGTTTDVGVFGAVFRILTPLGMIVVALLTAINPPIIRFQQEDPERCKQYTFYGLKLVLTGGVLLAMLCTVATPWIITLLTGGTYSANTLEFALFAWVLVPNFAVVYIFFVCVALGMQKRATFIALALAVVSVALSPVLTARFLAPGAVVVKLAANIAAAGVAFHILASFLDNGWLRAFLPKLLVLTIAGAVSAPLLLVYVPVHISLLIIVAVFVTLVFVMKLIGAREMEIMKSFGGSLARKLRMSRSA